MLGGNSAYERGGMLVVSLRGVNFGFWSHFRVLWAKHHHVRPWRSRLGLHTKKYIWYTWYIFFSSLLGVKKTLGPRPDRSPLGVSFKISAEHPHPFDMPSPPQDCNPILPVTTGESMRIPGSTPMLMVLYTKCSHAKQAVHMKSSRLWMSEENFHTELSRITFYHLSYILSFNYSYRYEINLIQIMYTAN